MGEVYLAEETKAPRWPQSHDPSRGESGVVPPFSPKIKKAPIRHKDRGLGGLPRGVGFPRNGVSRRMRH